MTFSRQILVGLGAGLATGLLLGELVAPLAIVAEAFIRLLQMTVLPYVTVSIISSLGSLSLSQARQLGIRAGAVLLGIWAIALGVTLLFPLAFPSVETATFFSTSLLDRPVPFNFVDLYIPSNPFHALANSIVPAVVLFSVIVGVALIGVERKQALLEVLQTASVVISRATRGVTRLSPYGLFAVAAVAAGTLTIEQLERIEVYLLAYVAITLVVALWLLPGLIALLTGISVRHLLSRALDPLIVAFVAGDLFIVLPGLIEACKDLLSERHDDPAVSGLPDVIVPVAFNFPHTGKLLSLSFIPFAAWFADAPLSASDYPQLIGAGFLSFFGSLNAAVPFLLDLFHLPADTFQLFLATSVINSRFGTLVAAMHTIAMAILGSLALTGGLRWPIRRIVRFGVVTTLLLVGTLGGLRALFATVLREEFTGAEVIYSMTSRFGGPPARLSQEFPAESSTDTPGQGVLNAIRERGALRVAVLRERMPFVFKNREGGLVGMDVELAQMLAADIGVSVQFYQTEVRELPALLGSGRCDIAMSGISVTPERAAKLLFSTPYLDETLAFVMNDHLRDGFTSWDAIRALGRVRVAIPDILEYRLAVRSRAPDLELITIGAIEDLFRPGDDVVAYVLPAERGSVLTLLHPSYSVVVPQPDRIRLPVAFPLATDDGRWATFINSWIELRRRDGTLDELYGYWILGHRATPAKPRWSIVRNVFGWVDGSPSPDSTKVQ
jgi:Na+/H+-dicarboxylate symporter/ABC-type amino acid transport substrate-binding protein